MIVLQYILMGFLFCDVLAFWLRRQGKLEKNLSTMETLCYGMTWPMFPFVVIMYIIFKGTKKTA